MLARAGVGARGAGDGSGGERLTAIFRTTPSSQPFPSRPRPSTSIPHPQKTAPGTGRGRERYPGARCHRPVGAGALGANRQRLAARLYVGGAGTLALLGRGTLRRSRPRAAYKCKSLGGCSLFQEHQCVFPCGPPRSSPPPIPRPASGCVKRSLVPAPDGVSTDPVPVTVPFVPRPPSHHLWKPKGLRCARKSVVLTRTSHSHISPPTRELSAPADPRPQVINGHSFLLH